MPITRNGKGASLAPALPRLNAAANSTAAASRYSISKDDVINTEMVDGDEALTTSGRTYEELVSASLHHQRDSGGSMAARGLLRDSMMSDETEESESSPSHNDSNRQSVGVMLGRNLNTWSTGRNSLSNWSTIGGGGGGGTPNDGIDDNTESRIPSSVHMGGLDTGRKSNISIPSLGGGGRNSLETPSIAAVHVNISHRNVNSRATQRSNIGSARVSRPSSLNMSHISSSSSSGLLEASGDMLEDESWTPIRTSLENSFDNTAPSNNKKTSSSSLGGFKSSGGSLSPIRGRSSTSPKRSPVKGSKSPVRSPFGDVSPNRSPTHSPKKKTMSPKKGSMTLPKKKLSPNGTYSLMEAEGKRLSMPASTTSTVTTNIDSGSGGSSNMSVSSGSDAAMTSGVTLERRTSSTKLVLPSLSASRKSMNEKAAAAAVTDAELTLTTLSPVKTSTKVNVRSPVPTPNSQRKVVKRFRASVPSANYLNQDDLADTEEMVMVAAKPAGTTSVDVANDLEVDTTTTQTLSYENAFVFPSDSIPKPSIKTLRVFHDQAVAVGTPSHQYQLNCAKSNIMSLHEVILPAIAYEMSTVLRQMQAKAQRNVKDGMPASQGQEVVEAIETCRRLVAKCNYEAVKVAGETWRDQEATREKLRMERLERDVEQQRLETRRAKRERKEARARSRQERHERQKSDKKRNHPRNKELWQEILKLTGDIQKLEKEERLWKEVLVEVKDMEDNLQAPERQDLETLLGKEKGNVELVESVANANLESVATNLVGDVTMATERINWMLKSVSLAMDESDKLRKEAYDKYQYDGHKFVGYPKVDDPKGLFMALSMESPYKQ